MKEGKVWGETRLLLKTAFVQLARVHIEPHTQCSMHKHEFKTNAFLVLSGRLTIVVRKNDYDLTDRTELGPGDITIVRPNEFHRFVTHDEPVDALEIYYPTEIGDDIVREDCGSRIGG